jgi:hypothetical protein
MSEGEFIINIGVELGVCLHSFSVAVTECHTMGNLLRKDISYREVQ